MKRIGVWTLKLTALISVIMGAILFHKSGNVFILIPTGIITLTMLCWSDNINKDEI